MLQKSTIKHLRIPFSVFLSPVFTMAIAFAGDALAIWQIVLSFCIIHLLVYPASNGYNSYFDKDEQSIGGLRVPPKVTTELYWVSLALDVLAVGLSLLLGVVFAAGMLVYGLISKAYSHPLIRLKRYPWLSALVVSSFQGGFVFLLVASIGMDWEELSNTKVLVGASLTSLMLLGSYPMTQIYQHQEDAKRGDKTLSIILGIKGTFHFTFGLFSLTISALLLYLYVYFGWFWAMVMPMVLFPLLVFTIYWYLLVRQNEAMADFDHTMRLNLLSSICMNLYFVLLISLA